MPELPVKPKAAEMRPGDIYINEMGSIVRVILHITSERPYYVSYLSAMATLPDDHPSYGDCSRQRLAQWAERKLTADEVVKLRKRTPKLFHEGTTLRIAE